MNRGYGVLMLLTVAVMVGISVPAFTAQTRTPLNVWHIPSNEEPPSVTMRNPLDPNQLTETVFFYCGCYPLFTLWGGTLHYRLSGETEWTQVYFNWDSNQQENEYWITSFDNTYVEGDVVEYYLEMEGDPAVYETTYIYGTDNSSTTTLDEEDAQTSPYTFTVLTVNTPTVTPTTSGTPDTPTPTPTQGVLPTLNVWHIPTNEEPETITMRNPLEPETSTPEVYIYCGGHPQGTLWTGTLYYKLNENPVWESVLFSFDSNQSSNEYWQAVIQETYVDGDAVQYYLQMGGDPEVHTTTYVYGSDSQSFVTVDQFEAQSNAFFYIIGDGPTPTTVPGSPTATPTGPPQTPSPTATAATRTPTPAATMTRTPTPTTATTPTSIPETLGVELAMPSHSFTTGEVCWLNVTVINTTGTPVNNAHLFVVLDVYGSYFFWPSWVAYPPEIDSMPINVPETVLIHAIEPFMWPTGAGSASGLFFLGALLDSSITTVYGEIDTWEFEYF